MKFVLASIAALFSLTASANWENHEDGYWHEGGNMFLSITLSGNVSYQQATTLCANRGYRLPYWEELDFARNSGLVQKKRNQGDDTTWWFWSMDGRRYSLEGLHINGNVAKTICGYGPR